MKEEILKIPLKTMLDPRFEQADRRIRAKMLFEKTTLIKPDGRCFEELKKEVMDEGRQIIESGTNLLNMKRLKISEAVGQIMDFCLENECELRKFWLILIILLSRRSANITQPNNIKSLDEWENWLKMK